MRPKRELEPAVYILASSLNGTLYIGVTSSIFDRIQQHKAGTIEGFSRKYRVTQLVYVEFHDTMDDAILPEKQLKKWNRLWKIRLIEQMNPTWTDLWDDKHGRMLTGTGGQILPSGPFNR